MAKKDFYSVWTYKSPEGDKDLSLPNLEVVNLLKSLKSSGYVKETFNWYVRNTWRRGEVCVCVCVSVCAGVEDGELGRNK